MNQPTQPGPGLRAIPAADFDQAGSDLHPFMAVTDLDGRPLAQRPDSDQPFDYTDFLSLALAKLDDCARDGRAALVVPQEAAAVLDYIRKHGIAQQVSGRDLAGRKLGKGEGE